MTDSFKKLYDNISNRKSKPEDFSPYTGGNGRIDRAADIIMNEGFPLGGTIVDVGGATGNLGYSLRDLFSERHVIDIADVCRGPAEAKGNIFHQRNIDADGLPFEDLSVDLIVALDFIEHIIDPNMFANECFRCLRFGGNVLINTPNIQFWRHLESLVCAGRFPHTSGDSEVYHGGHVAFFNLSDLRIIFSLFSDHRMHVKQLTADPPPPIWHNLAKYADAGLQLSYPDIIFSCKK